jgi:secreted protein with Ig-like and vWFA domain
VVSTPTQITVLDGAIPLQRSSRVKLDVAFLFDTTGSMGDELAQLQNNVMYIAGDIARWNASVDVRYGLVAYKDQGDAYVTQAYPFTDSAAQFQTNLLQLSAGGGGDTPEDLAAGLEVALHNLQWRDDDTIQLIFIVTDASAQLYGGFTYMDGIKEAAQRGIKIHSLAASGLEQDGEYMLRQASEITMGRFIFLTYDASQPVLASAPGEDRPDLNVGEAKDENGVGEYAVEQLPQLVLRLIREEVAFVVPQQ